MPIIVTIIALIFVFNYAQFADNFFGGADMPEKPLWQQVRDTMLITVFVFLGIEGASVYSRFAKTRADVGRATILGFVGVTGLMVAITLLPYASMTQSPDRRPAPAVAGRRARIGGRPLGRDLHLGRRARSRCSAPISPGR